MKYNAPIGAANPNDPYIDGNPGAGVEGSPVPAATLEHPMREIVKVITEAGLIPTETDLTQLYQAIQILIAANTAPNATTTNKGIVELTDGPEALGGTDSARAVTSAALASAKNYATNGYQKLPGGLILQWGTVALAAEAAGGHTLAVTFPVAFITSRIVTCSTRYAGPYGDNANISQVVGGSNTGFTATNQLVNSAQPNIAINFDWLAIGY